MYRIGIDDEKLSDAVVDYAICMSNLDVITNRYIFETPKKTIAMACKCEVSDITEISSARHATGPAIENPI